MAPLPVIADTFRLTINWRPLVAANVMHFSKPDGNAEDLLEKFGSHITTNMWGPIPPSQGIVSVVVTPLDGESTTDIGTTDGSAKWHGDSHVTGEPIPNTAAVLSMHTAFRGRSHRGRIFLGPAAEGASAAGMMSGAQTSALVGAWDDFQTLMIGDGWVHVVASYLHATAAGVTSYSCRNAMGTVRRRQSQLA